MFRKLTVMLAVLAAALLGGWGVAAGTAEANPGSIPIGGGSGILVLQGGQSAAACTLTTIGRAEGKPGLVGITAGHCGQPGQAVLSETFADRGQVGTITYSAEDLDLAIIEFNDKAAPLRTVRGATIRGVSRNQPAFPTILCKEGRTTGNTCGVTWFSDGGVHLTQICVVEGDSGSPVIAGDRLVGMVNAYYFFGCIGPETGTNIGPILDRMDRVGYQNFRVA